MRNHSISAVFQGEKVGMTTHIDGPRSVKRIYFRQGNEYFVKEIIYDVSDDEGDCEITYGLEEKQAIAAFVEAMHFDYDNSRWDSVTYEIYTPKLRQVVEAVA